MRTWVLIEHGDIRTFFSLIEGAFNEGFIDQYKKDVRQNGGRVVAVIRRKLIRSQ